MPEQENPQGTGEQQPPTIGGPTAHQMGTEYELISEAGRRTVQNSESSEDAKGAVGHNPEGRADTGREPMYYAEKHTPPGKLGAEQPGPDYAGPSDHPGTAEPRSGVPD